MRIFVGKKIIDLPGISDLVLKPRNWSQQQIGHINENILLEYPREMEARFQATIEFLYHHFFFALHQTGLNNYQKRFWMAFTEFQKIEIKDKREGIQVKLSNDTNEYALLVFLNGAEDFNLNSDMKHKNCFAVNYFKIGEFDEKFQDKLIKKVKSLKPHDDYDSVITKTAVVNMFTYEQSEKDFRFKLTYPAIKVEGSVCLEHLLEA